jgi:hypothetical protein
MNQGPLGGVAALSGTDRFRAGAGDLFIMPSYILETLIVARS